MKKRTKLLMFYCCCNNPGCMELGPCSGTEVVTLPKTFRYGKQDPRAKRWLPILNKIHTEDEVEALLSAHDTDQTILKIRRTHFPKFAFTEKHRLRNDRPYLNPSWDPSLRTTDDNNTDEDGNNEDNEPIQDPAPPRSTEPVVAGLYWDVVDKLRAKTEETECLQLELQECKEENKLLRDRINKLEREAKALQALHTKLLGSTCLSYAR
jgi:hypothetical protein